tara:strand:+ start:675 stop:1211 length:537 start_codon:yes stop_codon:yes gene_type:complete
MKQIFEYLPLIIFTISYFYNRDIFFATLVLLICLFTQLCIEYILEKKISKKTKIVFGVSLFFGGSTLFFRNEEFLFWRPTVINWIFVVLFLGFELYSGKYLLKIVMGKAILLPDNVWKKLNRGWCLGFFVLGLLNIIIAYNFSLDFWVSYKLFGGLLITFSYMIITMIYLWKGGFLKN